MEKTKIGKLKYGHNVFQGDRLPIKDSDMSMVICSERDLNRYKKSYCHDIKVVINRDAKSLMDVFAIHAFEGGREEYKNNKANWLKNEGTNE
jgi:hypothetical protein